MVRVHFFMDQLNSCDGNQAEGVQDDSLQLRPPQVYFCPNRELFCNLRTPSGVLFDLQLYSSAAIPIIYWLLPKKPENLALIWIWL